MSGNSLLDTVELDQHDALLQAAFVDLRRLAARQKAASPGSEGRTGELRVSKHERIAVEIVKLAEKRHEELIK